ncbi:hypothetical protein RB195_015966 [Necator americanus]|uniref:Uncharacterized protein n=1 Tax=Necator americanus TaxID=51031 RepID=A0ABR1E6Y2_NECAM
MYRSETWAAPPTMMDRFDSLCVNRCGVLADDTVHQHLAPPSKVPAESRLRLRKLNVDKQFRAMFKDGTPRRRCG